MKGNIGTEVTFLGKNSIRRNFRHNNPQLIKTGINKGPRKESERCVISDKIEQNQEISVEKTVFFNIMQATWSQWDL